MWTIDVSAETTETSFGFHLWRKVRKTGLDPFIFSVNQVGGTTIDGAINYPPIQPIPDLPAWAETLQQIAAGPLEFCQDLPTIARRFEAWWAQDLLDRPVFIATANADPSRPITRRLDLLDQPDGWFEAKFADMLQTHRVGDALPNVRVDFGPVLLGGLFGGELEFGADTTWTHAFIDDGWSNAPDWTIRDDNHWWVLLRKLIKLGPNQFKTLFLPDIARHAGTVGRAVFHLDGPDAARHVDALLDVPDIQAIQFTPGAGMPSALAWIDMFRKIQQRGRSVLVICPAEEVLALCESLHPEGLAIWVDTPLTPDELDDLFARFCKLY